MLAARDPSNAQWQRAIGVDADRMGSLMRARGDLKAALPWSRESDAASLRVAAIAPGNLEWQRDVFISALQLGMLLAELDRLDEARTELQRAVDIQERLMTTTAPDTARAERELSLALDQLGAVELKAHHLAAGQALLLRSIETLKRYFRKVDTPAVRQDLAHTLLRLAESERGIVARDHLEEAVGILDPIRALSEGNPELRRLMVQVDEARRTARARR
ncbi:MAG: tetratricopeptide repeat protein [Minicystis sp.]